MSPELSEIVNAHPLETIEALAPLMSDERIERIEQVLAARMRSIIVVLDHLKDPHNRAAILRTSEAMGIQEIHVITPGGHWPLSRRVTQGCHKWLDIFVYSSADVCAKHLDERGYTLIEASEKTDEDALHGALPSAIGPTRPVALCLGNEHAGLTDGLRRHCSNTLGIPMLGFTKSFNVSVAAALLIRRLAEGRTRGLTGADENLLRARYYALSVRAPLMVLRREVGP